MTNYYKEAFLYQYNIICLAAVAVLAFIALVSSMSFLWGLVLLGLGVEVLYLLFAPSFSNFRKWAERKSQKDTQEDYEEEMQERLGQVSPEFQRRFYSVNQLVVDFQTKVTRDGVGELMGGVLHKLLLLRDRYLKMILDQHELNSFVTSTDGLGLNRQLEVLSKRLEEKGLHRRIRDNLKQRQEILRKRIAHLGKAATNRDMLGYELETIYDLIQLIRESSMTLADPDNLSRQIDDILIGIESAEEAMEEVADMDYEEEPIEGPDPFANFDSQLDEALAEAEVHEFKH